MFFQYESTLLHEAVSMDNADLVEMLIKAGANVNSTNKVCFVSTLLLLSISYYLMVILLYILLSYVHNSKQAK